MNRIAVLCLLGLATGADAQVIQPSSSITEISLRRTACFGRCPIYEVSFSRTGEATYYGERWAKMIGHYRATIDSTAFEDLVQHVAGRGFFGFDTAYVMPATDQPTTYLCVRRTETRCVRRYGQAGPRDLDGMEAAVDRLVRRVAWANRDPQ
jgi:hypothetical protein